MKLNEHGAALKVFWTPTNRSWVQQSGLTNRVSVRKTKLPKETSRREQGQSDLPAPFGSKWEWLAASALEPDG